jgi:cytochrome c oxidase assembly protein subunit 11
MNLAGLNRHMLRKLAVITVGMFGFGYALVPLYEAICEVTGINILAIGEQTFTTGKSKLPANSVPCRCIPVSLPR